MGAAGSAQGKLSAEQINEMCVTYLGRQESLVKQLELVCATQKETLARLRAEGSEDDYDVEEREAVYDPSANKLMEELLLMGKKADKSVGRSKGDADAGDDGEAEEGRGFTAVKPWLGAMAPPSDWKADPALDEAPAIKLEMEHVYGYRSRTCRNNLGMVGEDKVIFPAAAVGVVHDISDNAQRFFGGHNDDIISLCYHPGRKLVATGQQGKKPSMKIWSAEAPEKELATLEGTLERGVVSLTFNKSGDRVMGIGMDEDNTIVLYEWSGAKKITEIKGGTAAYLHSAYNATSGVDGDKNFVAVGVKVVNFISEKDGKLDLSKGLLGKHGESQAFTSVGFTAACTVVCTGGGELYLFSENKLKSVIKAHSAPATVVERMMVNNASVIMSGGQDGKMILWDEESLSTDIPKKKVVIDINDKIPAINGVNSVRAAASVPNTSKVAIGLASGAIYTVDVQAVDAAPELVVHGHYGDLKDKADYGEAWGLAALPGSKVAVSCGDDQTLRVWDTSIRKMTQAISLGGHGLCCDVHIGGDMVAVGLKDGRICLVSLKEKTKVGEVKHAKDRIQVLRFSPCGKKLGAGTGSKDRRVLIYDFSVDARTLSPSAAGTGSSSAINHLDWAADSSVVCVDSQSYEIMYFEANGNRRADTRAFKDTPMMTSTCVLGFSVQGIWPKNANGTDVNNVARSPDNKLLATCDDFGMVNVYNYPCIGSGLDSAGSLKKRPAAIVGQGHSEHVANVTWCQGGKSLLTVGGADNAVIQWKVVSA